MVHNRPGMGDLPFLLRWGQAVWVALWLGAIVLGFALVRRRQHREAERAVSALEAPLDALEEGVHSMAGELSAEEPCQHFLGGDAAAVSADVRHGSAVRATRSTMRAGKLRLITAQGSVEILGDVEVLAGSREQMFARRMPALPSHVHDRIAAADRWRDVEVASSAFDTSIRSLHHGDAIVAHGLIHACSDSQREASYRGRSQRYELVPESDDDAVVLAFAGASSRRFPLLGALRGAAWGGGIALVVFICAGAWALQAIPEPPSDEADYYPELGAAVQIAAATPFHRGTALQKARALLGGGGRWDRLRARRLTALGGDHAQDCSAAVEQLASRGVFQDAAGVASACELHREAGKAWLGLGEFARASDAFEQMESTDANDWELAGQTHLMARRFDRAARAAVRQAQTLHVFPTPWKRPSLECLARALEAVGGDRAAATKLGDASSADSVAKGACKLLHAMVVIEPAKRKKALAAIEHASLIEWMRQLLLARHGEPSDDYGAIAEFLHAPGTWGPLDPRPGWTSASGIMRALVARAPGAPKDLEARMAASHGEEAVDQAERRLVVPRMLWLSVAERVANSASMLGDDEGARRILTRAEPVAALMDRYVDSRLRRAARLSAFEDWAVHNVVPRIRVTAALCEMRAGKLGKARDALAKVPQRAEDWDEVIAEVKGLLDVRERGDVGDLPKRLFDLQYEWARKDDAAFRSAAKGDGALLLQQLHGDLKLWMIAVAPRIQQREELLAWMNDGRWAPSVYDIEIHVLALGRALEMARAIEATERAAQLESALEKYRMVLEDERISFLFTLWQEI